MHDLRLIGVHDDGVHLLLASSDGTRYRLPLDEALRAAARRDRPRLGQLQIEIEGGLRPRDVQALIRGGMPSAEVAERAGWTLEKVAKYEGPILAEREYIAGLARASTIRGRSGSASLGARVTERLASREVPGDSLDWDAWRKDGSEWVVTASFTAGGRARVATWAYDVRTRSLVARDDEARWLTEDPPITDPVEARKAAPVYDVEAEGGITTLRSRRRGTATADLAASMRESSGARARKVTPPRPTVEAVVLPLLPGHDDPPSPASADAPADPSDGSGAQPLRGSSGQLQDSAASPVAGIGPSDVAEVDAAAGVAAEEATTEPEPAATAPAPALAPETDPQPAHDDDGSSSRPTRRAHSARAALTQERLRQAWDVHVFGPARGDATDLP